MKLPKINNKFWALFITIAAVAFFVPNVVQALTLAQEVGQLIGRVLFYVLFSPFILLLKVEMMILPVVAQYNNFTSQAGVQAGWIAARDLVNMLFIVVLLVMAFGTILKIQNYGYRQLLRRLIIMAILVNFSRTLVGLIIDLFQVIMLTFVSAWKDVVYSNLTVALGLDNLVRFAPGAEDPSGDVIGSIIVGYLLAGIMAVIASIVIMAFIVILVARIVMLWIVVVISPIAFLANTIPKGEGYFQRWMDMLTKELVIGPMLAFFLWLSFMILQSGDIASDFTKDPLALSGENTAEFDVAAEGDAENQIRIGITEAGSWNNVLNYIVGIAMLIGSLKVTSSFGAAAGAVGSKVAAGMKSKVSGAYRWAGKSAVSGSSGYGGLVGLGGKAADRLGAGLQRTGMRPLIAAGGALKGMEANRKVQHEEKRLANRMAKNIKDPAERLKFLEAIPNTGFLRAKAMMDNKTLFNKQANNTPEGNQENRVNAKAAYKALIAGGDFDGAKKLQASNALSHSDENGKNSVEEMLKEQGLAGFNNMDPETLFDHNGQLHAEGKLIVEQFKNYKIGEQQKFLSSKSRTTQDRWSDALIAHANNNVLGKTEDFEGQEDKDKPLVMTNADGTHQVNVKHQGYGLVSTNPKAMKSFLASPNFDPEHQDNISKTEGEKTIIASHRQALISSAAPQLARSIKDDDLLEMKDGDKEDTPVLQAMAPYLPISKVNAIAERGGNETRTKMVVEAQIKAGNNIESLATNVATRRYVKEEDVAQSFQAQIDGIKQNYDNEIANAAKNGRTIAVDAAKIALEQDNMRVQLAKSNLQYAGEAFGKVQGRNSDGKPARVFKDDTTKQAFAKFVNGLSSNQALKIEKSDLETVFDDLSESMRDSLRLSGVGGSGQRPRLVTSSTNADYSSATSQSTVNRNANRRS